MLPDTSIASMMVAARGQVIIAAGRAAGEQQGGHGQQQQQPAAHGGASRAPCPWPASTSARLAITHAVFLRRRSSQT
jgi:hypothetical protein